MRSSWLASGRGLTRSGLKTTFSSFLAVMPCGRMLPEYLIGKADGNKYRCIHDHGAQEYILRTQFASLGLKSPQVVIPLVSRKP